MANKYGLLRLFLLVSASCSLSAGAPTSETPKPVGVCPYEECECTGLRVDCAARGLTEIPALASGYTPGQFPVVDFNHNPFTSISDGQLPANITHLDLRLVPIASLSDNAFQASRDTLKALSFQGANMTELPAAPLRSLNALERFEFSHCNVTLWRSDVIEHLGPKLTMIDVSNTGLTRWPEWIKYLVFLKEITLAHNVIKAIPATAMREWRNQLTDLDLSYTGLRATSFLTELRNLFRLQLQGNELSNQMSLSFDLIPLSRSLYFLDLSANRMSVAPRLSELTNLRWVDLSSNLLSKTESASFPVSLKTLMLNFNRFTEIPESVKDLGYLEELFIRNNSIKSITVKQMMNEINSLVTLDLAGNRITSISSHAFENLTSLKRLDLSSIAITRLPQALKQLKSIQSLNLEGISTLMCMCEGKGLGEWYNSKKLQLTIRGNCGKLPITDFISMFLKNCS